MIGEPASAIFVIVHSQQGYVVEEAEWRAGVAQLQLHSLAASDLSVGCVTRHEGGAKVQSAVAGD